MKNVSARVLAIGLPLTAVAATGAAVAFWSGAAGGDASAKAATAAEALVLAPKTALTGLMPGGSVTATVSATNNNATTSVSISGLTVSAIKSDTAACDLVSGATAEVKAPSAAVTVAPKATADYGSVTISMANSTGNQDACKGATFSVTLSSS